jgi:hypothetical protein
LLCFAVDAHAQYQGSEGYYGGDQPAGQPAAGTDPNAGAGYYDPGTGSYGDPAYGGQPQPQPQPQPTAAVSVSTAPAAEGAANGIKGFELGINWLGGPVNQVAIQPGYLFGKFGIYLLAGLWFSTTQRTVTTSDAELDPWGYPAAPGDATANPAGMHHAGVGNWDETADIKFNELRYEVGLAMRFYLLDSLKAQSPNLYLELGLGWRGAAVKNEISWDYAGDLEALGDVNADGAIDGDDAKDLEFDRNKTWNRVAEDYAHDAEQKAQGLWVNLGLGGEYVFVGGFGIAGEVGLSLFWNTPWTEKGPFGYDDDGSLAEFDWEYEDVKYRGWGVDFGFYYNLALRYHF